MNGPLRVLHVYRTYFPESQGGLEEAIRQICLGSARQGVENRVLTIANVKQREVIARSEAEVIRYPRNLVVASCDMSLQAMSAFHKETEWADVLHYHFPWPFADIMHLCNRIQKPAIMTYHSDIVRQRLFLKLYRPAMHRFLSKMTSIVATSPNYFATSKVLQRYKSKVQVIPFGLDHGSYPSVEKEALRQLEHDVGREFFLFVGVLRYYKGLHVLLDAIKDTDLSIVIAGTGPKEAELKQKAERYKLRNIRFLGHVSDEVKVGLLTLARAVVLPSCLRSEAFGITLLEGAMFGKPLISTELGTGTSYVNLDGVTGYVVPPDDPRRLQEAMLHLQADTAMSRRMGMAVHERYMKYFSAEEMGLRYAAIYRQAASRIDGRMN